MINLKFISVLILLFLTSAYSYCQPKMIYPRRGVEGVPIVIDTSSINDVFNVYGKDYSDMKYGYKKIIYTYEKLGLSFEIDPYDKNQIIRSISVEYPFSAQDENGIILNESSMEDVLRVYKLYGCNSDKYEAYSGTKSVEFFIKKDSPDRFDIKQKIYKIKVVNKDEYGFTSSINYEYNKQPVIEKLNFLILILKSEHCSIESAESFFVSRKNEKEIEKRKPYGVDIHNYDKRNLEYGLTQFNVEFFIASDMFDMTSVFRYNELIYAKIKKEGGHDSLIFERKEIGRIESVLNRRNIPRDTSESFSNIEFPFDSYTFGSFCGIVGTPLKECRDMFSLLQKNKYNELSKWLHSLNPEIAAYGYVGMEYMKMRGLPITSIDKSRMTELLNSDIPINVCLGCVYGNTKLIREMITEKWLLRNYREFQFTGWLKFGDTETKLRKLRNRYFYY